MSKRHHNKAAGVVAPAAHQTVAIVGTHPLTRGDAPWTDETKDIWIFNNQILQGWCPRANACFDIHPTEDIYRRSLEHQQFKEWLAKEKGMDYYTPFEVPDAPNNLIYPKDQIVKSLLPKFLRGEKVNEYFTSGPCYAIALAIYKGYKRIELYGIEMEADSEYIYQRDGVALWLGIALGHGITVSLPEKSVMFWAPLYGFDADTTKIDREAFVVRASELEEAMSSTLEYLNICRGRLDELTNSINLAKRAGVPEEEMIKFTEPFQKATNDYEQAIANHAFVNGQYIDCKAWGARIDKAMEYSGKAQEVIALRGEKWHRFADRAELSGGWMANGEVVGQAHAELKPVPPLMQPDPPQGHAL